MSERAYRIASQIRALFREEVAQRSPQRPPELGDNVPLGMFINVVAGVVADELDVLERRIAELEGR